VSNQQTLLDSMFKSIEKTKPEDKETDVRAVHVETIVEDVCEEVLVKEEAEIERTQQKKPLIKEEPIRTKQRARREAEDAIHGHIRLQSAEQLLKRVDTGFGQKSRAPFQTIVEGVQNSADAVDKAREAQKKSGHTQDYEAQITVRVEIIDKSRGELFISIEDNGIGIPKGKVAIIMRAGGTGTVEYKASRSQQGIGWKAAAIYSNQSTGKPAEIISKTFFEKQPHRHVYDYGKGKVTKILEEPFEDEFSEHGTRMSLYLIGDYPRARNNIKEFMKRMAAVHPYITFTFHENGTPVVYEKRSGSSIPIPIPVPPHPNSVDIGQLKDMLAAQSRERSIWVSGFLKRAFCRIGSKSIDGLIERTTILMYFDMKGVFAGDIVKRIAQSDKAARLKKEGPSQVEYYLEKVLVRDYEIDYKFSSELVMKGRLAQGKNIRFLSNQDIIRLFKIEKSDLPKPPFTPKTTVNMILSDEGKVRLLTETLRSMFFPAPPIDSLMPIPKDVFIDGFVTLYQPDNHFFIERKPSSTSGRPIQVQVLGMYGGEIPFDMKDQEKLIRIANCTPLIYEFGSDITTQTLKEIDWPRYKLGRRGELPSGPVIFVVHVTSPQLKYLGVAKQAIGADDVIASEIKFAVQATARKLGEHVKRLEKDKAAGQVRKYLEKYATVVSETLNKMIDADKDEVYNSLIEEIKRRRPLVFEEPQAETVPAQNRMEAEDVKVED
jgi:DNA topoisomerase-6 subunit B